MSCRWVVVQTEPRRERTACEHIDRQDAEAYCPMYLDERVERGRRIARAAVLFPCYVFVRVCGSSIRFLGGTRAVKSIVSMGERASIIKDSIIAKLKAQEWDDGLIRLHAPRPTILRPGDAIKVVEGSFINHLGIYQGQDGASRVRVLFAMLGRETVTTMPLQSIEAV